MNAKKKYFMDCHLAGRMYHEADEVWNMLKVGTKVELVREEDNRYDPQAVMVCYNDEENDEQVCLGYIPREQNNTIALLMDMGYSDIFECRINQINEKAHPEQQVHLTIKIRRRDEEETTNKTTRKRK